ncbi:organic cation/carnitine transporter 7-like [Primulina huaijiensis]|uniref:organic cation/carnitine transporter 7-like n=1 Tax=Primulina huaijiensis TaxID=1492673 RepID=UPI003CC748C5
MGNFDPEFNLDEALATIGFGRYQYLLLAYGGLGWIAEAMEMMILSFIGSSVQSEWNLSSAEKSLISTMVFAGMLVGASFWGLVSDSFGRKKGILGVATITAVAGLLSAFSPNYMSLIIVRCIAGIGLGGMHIFTSWFLEFVPTPNRGAWMIVLSSFWTVGTIFEAALAWIVSPNLGWRWLVALSSVLAFIVLLLYGFVPESPRFLCMKGRIMEARSILENAALINRISLGTGMLISDQRHDHYTASENTHLLSPKRDGTHDCNSSSSSVSVLFSLKLIRTNLLLWFLYFGNTFSYYGIILLTSELSSGESKCANIRLHSAKGQNSGLYVDVFLTSLAELPGLVLSAFAVDKLGRKLSMVLMFILGSILLLPLLSRQNDILTTTLLFGARTFISATFTVACIYAPEVYPTNIRSTGVGIATAIGRIGGMVCPLVAVGLVNGCHQAAAVILFVITILLSALSVLLSPFETNGRNLSDSLGST